MGTGRQSTGADGARRKAVLLTVVGVGAIALALALGDIVTTVVHPTTRNGSPSRGVTNANWRLFQLAARSRPTVLSYAGPIALITIIAGWAALLAVG